MYSKGTKILSCLVFLYSPLVSAGGGHIPDGSNNQEYLSKKNITNFILVSISILGGVGIYCTLIKKAEQKFQKQQKKFQQKCWWSLAEKSPGIITALTSVGIIYLLLRTVFSESL